MSRALTLVLAGSLFTAAAASADIPLPDNLRYVDPRVQFEGVDQHPDHVFYLRFLSFTGGPSGVPHRLVRVYDAGPFPLNAQRRLMDMELLAMERKVFDARARKDRTLDWLGDKTEDVLRASVTPPSTVGLAHLKEVPVTAYRVTLRDGKLTAERVKDEESRQALPAGPLPLWAFALVSSLSLAWLGIWFVRRGRPRAPSAPR